MKLTKTQLKRIIKEELQKVLNEDIPAWLDPTAGSRELYRKLRSGAAIDTLKAMMKGPPGSGRGDDCGHISDEAERHACYQRQKEERHADALAQAQAAAEQEAPDEPAVEKPAEEKLKKKTITRKPKKLSKRQRKDRRRRAFKNIVDGD